MSEIIGKQIEFGVGVENVRGTAQAIAEKWQKKVTATVVEKAEKKVDESTRNRIEDGLGTRLVKKWIEGEVEGNLHIDALGYYLYNLYGAVATSVVSGSIKSHLFSVNNTILSPSLTLFAKDGENSNERFNNAMVNTFELTAAVDDYVRYKASFMASEAAASTDTPAYTTEYDFVGKDVEVKVADTEAGLAGASATKVKELTLSFDKGLIADQILGSYTPDEIFATKLSLEGEIKLNYIDDTFKDFFTSDVYKYMQITVTGSQDIGSGNHPSITIVLNRVAITDWNREGNADELVSQTVSFKAFYNETDGEQSTITLQNLTAEYDEALS